jgi:hypothetical protein
MVEEKQTQPPTTQGAGFNPRLGGLVAYSLAVLVGFYAASLTSTAYHEACKAEVVFAAGVNPLQDVGIGLITILAILLPTLLARSKALVAVNLCLGLLTVVFAFLFLFSASTPPPECYSGGGSYEDHVSGLPEFTFYLIFVVVISYAFVLLDWSIWGVRNLAHALSRQ